MNAATLACAPSGVAWDGINWADVQRHVRRLQTRIVKATQAGRHNKAKALQWLLTHSFCGKALAVKRVTENKGKNTPGVDKVTWKTPRAKTNAIASLKRRGYSPLPLRRVMIPKKNGKTRPLGIPVMKCRAMQALHLLALEPIAETTADLNSYGFRPERSTADAGEQCFTCLAQKASAQWVLEADIQGCFDKISHDWMIPNISTDKVVLNKWLKAGFVYQNKLFPTDSGAPQGGIISPVLANMTLDGLELMLSEKFPKAKRTGRKMNMVRYADDFIITGNSKEWLEHEVKPAVVEFLAERGLVLSPEKTKVTHIKDGFDFLGWSIRKYNGKLLMKPSKANVKAHLGKIREVIKANRQAKQIDLINLLNPVLRGWANYHRHVVAKKTFNRIDAYVWSMLWRWAVRRHPNKGARWVKDRYFKTRGSRTWVFAATEEREDGTKRERSLLSEADTLIQRHIKIKASANPHDPQWEQYFESRWGKKMLSSSKGRGKLYRVWRRQDGMCSTCQKPITKNTPWDVRSIVKRTDGGSDAASNLQMHHLNCPRNQLHAKNEIG
ncbi:group II intron reverse transcriptase/maturase [Pseudomonas sp. S04]|uniref:group II intron reverse transcriptase/maturase n=1 Tax=unclassified Pseudomonas TaxID=196821 RepID=UPI00131FAD99|nr:MULTISPECIES: group II intron reverse transcriptase/maturase [unclassified Pseudomonas]QHD00733.1 group II intron reverse transcriptase/maturase [Pseudomonas sp. S04]QHD02052.1 group II intron reverse transcriptase/maturase [Pseudomonas sp. S04]QHF33218.1 group II intron reverse transcriptase/maturase [Pseudomonas sp. S19]QHF34535.1 group II intron reverse transcriptase/maturase [Pseudomonas sp. S19]